MHIFMKLAPFVLAMAASSAALGETTLDTSTSTTWRRSLTQMAVECDGAPRGACFLKLLEANKKIDGQYFDRFLKGVSGSSPAYQARYKEMTALRDKEMKGITRAELLRRAAAIK